MSVARWTSLALTLIVPLTSILTANANPTCDDAIVDVPATQPKAKTDKEIALYKRRIKEVARIFRVTLQLNEPGYQMLLESVDGDFLLVPKISLKELKEYEPATIETVKTRVVNAVAMFASKSGRPPSIEELAYLLNQPVSVISDLMGPDRLFVDFESIKAEAQKRKPGSFVRGLDRTVFTDAKTEALIQAIAKRRRMIVVTAVAAHPLPVPVNRVFLDSLLTYAKEQDAEIIVIPSNMQTFGLDPVLLNTPGIHILTNSIALSDHIMLNNIKIMAKQINPTMGLGRLGKRGVMQVIGSPKLHVRTVATVGNDQRPHLIMTTGAITEPIYNGVHEIQDRTNKIAEEDHVMGALILERSFGNNTSMTLEPGATGFYHPRHVEFVPEKGGFTDINRFYTPTGSRVARTAAVVFPDVHVGVTNRTFQTLMVNAIRTLKPTFVVLHDLFDGRSISHHERDDVISSARRFAKGHLDLEAELRAVTAFINALLTASPATEIRIVLSNHNLWLHRWLKEGRFTKEPHNTRLGSMLFDAYVNGSDPLLVALKHFGIKNLRRVTFVDETNWEQAGVELGQHGHIGPGGSRGSIRTLQEAANRIVFGHTHKTERRNFAVNVGTGTDLRQGYNREGPSAWSTSFAAISENGEIQVFIMREGEWWATDHAPAANDANFFAPGYPRLIPNKHPGVSAVTDQWSARVGNRR